MDPNQPDPDQSGECDFCIVGSKASLVFFKLSLNSDEPDCSEFYVEDIPPSCEDTDFVSAAFVDSGKNEKELVIGCSDGSIVYFEMHTNNAFANEGQKYEVCKG
jgi:hypothetical protein